MTIDDRLSDGYQPDFDIDLALGKQGELFVASIADALGSGSARAEVKTDAMIARTGNVYIEYECQRRDGWHPSGIASTTAQIWVFVLPANVLVAAPVENVRERCRTSWWRSDYRRECLVGSHPTKGIAVPVGKFVMDLYKFTSAITKAA